jgi:hypothetical protein
MITCYLRYVIDPYTLAEVEPYCRLVIRAIEEHGGRHHGHFRYCMRTILLFVRTRARHHVRDVWNG